MPPNSFHDIVPHHSKKIKHKKAGFPVFLCLSAKELGEKISIGLKPNTQQGECEGDKVPPQIGL